MLKKKPYIEERKTVTEEQLLGRVETLKSIGMTESQIQRDAQVRHFKGKIRQAKHQLAGILELESQIARKKEIKAEKLAAPKVAPPKKRHAQDPVKKKAKREKQIAPAAED
ncbi:MAG: hypothetical protein KQI81_14480 [Deltaproteobacteria bacterium]|nr:hypothetical protein [Deltaproteobacteria bacterium]